MSDEIESKPKSRVVYIILALTVGFLGIHNFYSGHKKMGFIKLALTVLTFWLIFPLFIIYIWILFEVFKTSHDAAGREMLIT